MTPSLGRLKGFGTILGSIVFCANLSILLAWSEDSPRSIPAGASDERALGNGTASDAPAAAAKESIAPSIRWHPAVDPAHDLTVGEFSMDILHNIGGLFSKRNIGPALIGGAATGLATIHEDELAEHFAPTEIWGAWSRPGNYIPYIESGASVVMFIASRNSTNLKFRSVSYALVQGLLVDTAVTYPLKLAVGRQRPNGENHHSFPSSHTSRAFTFATVLTEHYGWKAAVPSYLVAAYVGATRLEERKHYLSDVAAGAAIGFLIGHTVSHRMKRPPGKAARVDWMVQPGFKSLHVRVAIRLD